MKWNAALYDNKHGFVAKYGEDLIGWLEPVKGEQILDVGCGTGTLTRKLRESGAIVTGIDASENMIKKAKKTYPDVRFFIKDATDFYFEKKFDAVFSNATFHWINNQQKVLQCIYNSLKKGGRLVYEMGAKHNIESIHSALKEALIVERFEENAVMKVNYFSSAGEQASMLENVGFTLASIIQYDRPTELNGEDGMQNWINQFCQSFFINVPENKIITIINNAVERLKITNYQKGKWYADYKRLRIKAIKV